MVFDRYIMYNIEINDNDMQTTFAVEKKNALHAEPAPKHIV
jgi:hypothetical protein